MVALRKRFIVLAGLAVLAGVMVIGGCQTTQSGPLVAQPRSPILDVPLPVGFELKEMRSRSWTSGPLRFVDHLYSGDGERVAAVDFFEKQMAISGWTALSKQFTQGRSTLDYAKDDEKCRITIYKDGMYNSTYIQVAIWKDMQKKN